MTSASSSRSVQISESGRQKLRDRMSEMEKPEGVSTRGKKTWTQTYLAEQAHVDLSTVKRLLNQGKCDRDYARAILRTLNFDPSSFLAEYDQIIQAENKTPNVEPIPWQQIGRNIQEKRELDLLSSHPLGSANRRVKDVYVPLGLVERKQEQPRHKAQDVAPDDFSVLKQEQVETLKPVSHEEFFDRVLQRNSPKSAGRRIIVVGEPGAGKTTLLQKIAARVDGLAIWVDLASLKKDDTIEKYLLEWLRRAQQTIGQHVPKLVSDPSQLSSAVQQQFTTLFCEQPVWLLLDGADEMASELGHPLSWIAKQLRDGGWWTQARVVLTCRLNVWSAGGDRLSPTFDVYRNLDFEPEDVTDFIQKWFNDEPETIQNLQAEIDQASDRIKSLIRNPLRLTLLCLTWNKNGDKLPETKAGLYQRLVDAHYEWNNLKEEFVIERSLREKLDKKLGELAKRAIDRPESRFRLRESFILEDEEWGYPDDKGSLFWWAITLVLLG